MNKLDKIQWLFEQINSFLYGGFLIPLLILCGIYFTVKTRFVQLRFFPESFKLMLEKSSGNKTSAFSALMISTASKVGTGNVAGVASALVIGGPGSVFWMWVMSIVSSASAVVENTLAQMYKTVNDDKVSFRGGPAYYMQKALGNRKIGILFSVLCIVSFAYGFNALQSYAISSSFQYYIPNFGATVWPLVIGIFLAVMTTVIVFGGIHRIGFISSVIVPVMAGTYLLLGACVLFLNIDKLPGVLTAIWDGAFDFKSIFGGFAGSALSLGIKRGLLSNEAGLGSSPNVVASVDTSHPIKQGILQILPVFIDTILICSTTAFMVMLSDINLLKSFDGIPLVQQALNMQFGQVGIHFITFSIFAFAFSSIIANCCYAESNLLFIKNNKTLLSFFRVSCIVPVIFGATSSAEIVWNLSDITMGLMAIVNIAVILLLSKRFMVCLKDYCEQKKMGKDPVFVAPKCGIHDTTFWK
jgi:AGCS family alanine or glycine:cation symporter